MNTRTIVQAEPIMTEQELETFLRRALVDFSSSDVLTTLANVMDESDEDNEP